jgi:hypothetical protein
MSRVLSSSSTALRLSSVVLLSGGEADVVGRLEARFGRDVGRGVGTTTRLGAEKGGLGEPAGVGTGDSTGGGRIIPQEEAE